MEKKQVSISYIAEQLGVSPSTVSRALGGSAAISDSMTAKVRELADRLNYVPNQMAVNLKSGRRNAIAVIVPTVARQFFSSVIQGIEDYAHSQGYDVMICQNKNSIERERHLVSTIGGKVDGVIASLAAEQGSHSYFNNIHVPLVLFDRTDSTIKASCVTIDDFGGAVAATNHLLDQGFRRIYHFCGPQFVNVWRNRYLGYAATMEKYGIIVEPSWVHEAPTIEDAGRSYAQQLIVSGTLPDAIFFAGDYAALGAVTEFQRHGIDMPVVGFADESFCSYIRPSLTSVSQHSLRMGNVACKLLLDLIAGEPSVNTEITPELIIRESSLARK